MTRHRSARNVWWPWPAAPLALVILAVAVLAAPRRLEGPVLLPISPGHALAALDTLALLPLLLGTSWLYGGLWARRRRLLAVLHAAPGWSALALVGAGLGLGLLIASVLSTFFWWWAVGTTVFSLLLLAAVVAAVRTDDPGRPSPDE